MDDETRLEERLWEEIESTRVGMLGLSGEPVRHMQPMTCFLEKDELTAWFFTSRDTRIARDVGNAHKAMFCVVSKDRDLWACIGGELSPDNDPDRIARFWNAMVAAWYPKGKNDPNLVLLRFKLSDAEVWLSEAGPLRLTWEVAKANLTGKTPDEGERAHLQFQ